MAKIDIEEKFKKDISKEVANLKEFLISQGKEIVKLKQENKVISHLFELNKRIPIKIKRPCERPV